MTVQPFEEAGVVTQAEFGVAPEAIAEVRAIYERTGGAALASDVLTEARRPDSALHPLFEWDDTVAAAAYRLAQAEALIRRIRVEILPSGSTVPVRVRAYIATRGLRGAAMASGDPEIADAPPGSYTAIEHVAGRSAYEASVISSIAADLRRLEYKYRAHQDVFQQVIKRTASAIDGS